MSRLPENLERVADAGGWDKHALEVVKEMKGIKKEEWDIIHKTLLVLKQFTDAEAVQFFVDNINETISLKIEEMMAPLNNTITSILNEAMTPILGQLNIIVNNLASYLSEHAQGALIGGIAGQIAAMFLPGGPIIIAIGAILGAIVQDIFDGQAGPMPGLLDQYEQWKRLYPSGTLLQFITAYNEGWRYTPPTTPRRGGYQID